MAVGGFLPEQCLQFPWGRAARENICDNKTVLSGYTQNPLLLKKKNGTYVFFSDYKVIMAYRENCTSCRKVERRI